ncbi:hypothetical protein U14_00343 [Candidatus Moduliflexus flocculans]|uniref:Uncharacterized protein n=1 Tax=Candidatus Moduliflexus flocculans TaxID=1499966 RepID=A0A0S6VPW7_9BACT|nr:hypothetical protein U14_00343 [Candidatus Moduliflexus flocculans]
MVDLSFDFIFIQFPLFHLRDKEFPDARHAAQPHRMFTAIPSVKIANHAHALGIWRPDSKQRTFYAIQCHQMTTEFIINTIVFPFAEEIHIIFAYHRHKRIDIIKPPPLAVIRHDFQLIAKKFLMLREDCFKKISIGQAFHLMKPVFSHDIDIRFADIQKIRPHCDRAISIIFHAMHSKHRKWVLML